MYLSTSALRNKTLPQRQGMYLLCILDSYLLGHTSLPTAIGALNLKLGEIRACSSEDIARVAHFENLFAVENTELKITPALEELCHQLRQAQY